MMTIVAECVDLWWRRERKGNVMARDAWRGARRADVISQSGKTQIKVWYLANLLYSWNYTVAENPQKHYLPLCLIYDTVV